MLHSTFLTLKRAHLDDVDDEELFQNRQKECPFVQFQIDSKLFPDCVNKPRIRSILFSNVRDISKKSLDETVMNYILFIADIVKNDKYNRIFLRPASVAGERAWLEMLKLVIYCVVTLLYDVKWNSHYHFHLDHTIYELLRGKADALRIFFQKINVTHFTPTVFPVERDVEMLHFQNTAEFGPYYWRLLHWMAEAFEVRYGHDDIELAKSVWKEFIVSTLYRTLLCPRCMDHFREIVEKFKDRFLESRNYPQLWFEIHNVVKAKQKKPLFDRTEFEKESQAMKSVLVA